MKRLTFTVIFLIMLSFCIPAFAADNFSIDAPSYILIDSKTGQVLTEFNSNDRMYPASTTKIMTAILAIEQGDMNQMMTASKAAVNDIGKDGMNIGIMAGEELKLEDLLRALLIKSANETANIIAENICPTRDEFVARMNTRAKELGATNTNFMNTNGMHDPNHYTTVSDMAKFARYAMTLPKFREIVGMESFMMSPTNKHPKWDMLYTSNKLYGRQSNYYTKVTGIKTGYTSQAGYNLVASAVNNDGMELISVVYGMKKPGDDKNVYNYSKDLLEYGFKNYSLQKVASADQVIKTVGVSEAEDNSTLDLITAQDLSCVLPNDKNTWDLNAKEYITDYVKAPVNKGDILGFIEYSRNGTVLGKVDIVAAKSVDVKPRAEITKSVKKFFSTAFFKKAALIFATALALFVLLRITLRAISRALRFKRQGNG